MGAVTPTGESIYEKCFARLLANVASNAILLEVQVHKYLCSQAVDANRCGKLRVAQLTPSTMGDGHLMLSVNMFSATVTGVCFCCIFQRPG